MVSVLPGHRKHSHQVIREHFTSFSKLKQYVPPDHSQISFQLMSFQSRSSCGHKIFAQKKRRKPVVIVKEKLTHIFDSNQRKGRNKSPMV